MDRHVRRPVLLGYQEQKRFMPIKESDGISNPHIQGIGEDRKGNLWVTTDNGFTYLYIIDDPMDEKLTIRCYPFYEEDGIGDSPFTKGTVFCAGNGDILMGTGGQVLRVRPDDFIRIKRPNSLSFTGIGVSGKNIPIPEKGTSDKIRIKYKDILDIEVSAMDYLNRNKIRYEYAIDHKGWNPMQGMCHSIMGFNLGTTYCMHGLQAWATQISCLCTTNFCGSSL